MSPVTAQTSISLEKSQKLFQSIARYVAGGESNYVRVKNGLEMCFDRGDGPRFWDVDGNSFVDYSLGYGPLIFGHRPRQVTEAVIDVISSRGVQFTFPYDLEADVGRLIVESVPGVDLVRFCTTGTEAVSAAMRLARAYTGRDKIVKFEGHYHGWTDGMFVSCHPSLDSAGPSDHPHTVAGSKGTPRAALDLVVALPWNDPEVLEWTLVERGDNIAAVLMEPVMCNCGVIPPEPGYLQAVREITRRHGVLLIVDEVKTGFRLALGGAVEHYGLEPDIVTWAKALGAGYPVAAFGGTRDVMALEASNEVMHGGTYNAHTVAMAAAKCTLETMTASPQLFRDMWRRGERLREGLEEAARSAGHKAVCQGVGPLLQLFFTDGAERITEYRSAARHVDMEKFSEFQGALQDRGHYIHPDPLECFYLSTAHGDGDIEDTIAAAQEAVRAIR